MLADKIEVIMKNNGKTFNGRGQITIDPEVRKLVIPEVLRTETLSEFFAKTEKERKVKTQ